MKSLKAVSLLVLLFCFHFRQSNTSGAGRAFPIVSENYIIENFQRINPSLEWDPTNFLVDLSGQYANCRFIGTRGTVQVDRLTPEGNSIAGYVDYTDGTNVDVNSVNGYLKNVIDRWTNERKLDELIRGADRFGCSVRPGCSDEVSVSCLFSPAGGAEEIKEEEDKQKALAFTPQQYKLTEDLTNNRWDRSHFLENLSGFETDCAMIGNDDWQFTKAQKYASQMGIRLFGTYGSAPNYGSTQDALEQILKKLKKVTVASRVGCSIIPDCYNDRQMYVVVSCIYEEY